MILRTDPGKAYKYIKDNIGDFLDGGKLIIPYRTLEIYNRSDVDAIPPFGMKEQHLTLITSTINLKQDLIEVVKTPHFYSFILITKQQIKDDIQFNKELDDAGII